jgi:hypothetical protein
MAKGIETLAGPVSENDIIMRENEAPMGAAALMNKQVRKSVPGFYKLPSQKDDTPGFMKAAKAGVDQDMAQMDTISTMAGALMREGVDTRQMNPDQIIMLYEQMMGSVGDRDQFGVSKNQYPNNFADDEGGILLLPRNLRTAPGVPETSLAYITDDEKSLLSFMKPGTPHKGPEDVPSYDSLDYVAAPSKPVTGATQSTYDTGQSSYDDDKGGYDASTFNQQQQQEQQQNQNQNISNIIKDMNVKTGTKDKDDKSLGNLQFANFAKNILTSDNPKQALLDSDRYKDIQSLMDDYTPLTGNIGLEDLNLLGAFKALTKGGLGKKKKDRLFRKDEDGKDTDEMTREGFMEKLGDIKGGRDTFFNLIKRLDPQNFYKVTGMPQTSGGLEEMARAKLAVAEPGEKLTKEQQKYNNQVFEARELSRKDNNNNQMASGGFTQPAMPGDTSTVTPSEDAYKFNVGGTMPYTDDMLTGGKEMQVPVGRRMQLDSTGAMKTQPQTMEQLLGLATKGGGFNQLEDFNNYIKRRRKFLGEEEPEYFDEDGNVIMSGMEV